MEHHRNSILEADSEGGFEKAVATMLAEMAPSPLALLSRPDTDYTAKRDQRELFGADH